MALYRQTATGFVCEYASSPGAGFTLISAQPTDTIANRVTWWRNLDKGTFTSAWHPSELAGAEVPGRDTNAGSGVNILPNDYSSFEWAGAMPPNYTSGMTVNRTAAATYHGQYGVRLTTTSAGGTVWLAASGSDFNIPLAPSSKWIVSAYVRPLTNAAVSLSIRLKAQGGTTHSVTLTSGASSTGWVRVSGVLDLSSDTSAFGQLGVSLTNNSTSLDIDALMLEERIGPFTTASTFYSPWGNGLSDDEIPDGGISQDKLFGDLSDRIDLIDASSLVPGSVNARLASQYDTLVQQISEVSVGNGQFDSRIIYYFDAASEITGWTGTSASLAVSGGYLTVTGTGSNPKFKTATIAVDGSAYQLVRLRVKRTGGSGWTGTLRYYYAGGSNTITISEPAQIAAEYVEASWDMSAATLWKANTITSVEIQLGTASGDNYSIDWMGVGRNAPGASFSQVEAVRVLSDNKTRVFYQNAAPTSDANYTLKANDLWFDTDDGNKPYRWTGSAWAETTDTRLADSWAEILDIRNATANPSGAAAQRINSISATASAKNRTFYQASTSPPSSPTTGDIWFQTDQGNKAFRWSGSAWVETTDTRLPTAVASINTIETARIGYCTIGGNTSVHGDKTACEAAGGTWATGLPWATAVKQVSITAGNGQSATVQQQFETIYGAGGLRAQYSIKLDVSGYSVGFGLWNEGAGANGFIVRADKFVVGSAGSNRTPFVIDGGVTYIDAAVIKDGAITSAKIGTLNADKITGGYLSADRIEAGSITATKLALNTITAASGVIADAAITTAKIADAAITSAKIADASITNADIANATITGAKIANATIATANIGDLQVTNAKIANLSVDSYKIADAAITTAKIGNAQITGAKIADATITNAKIGDLQVTNAKIANLSVDSYKIADAAITTAKISDAQITGAKIANATITSANIGDAQITNAKIASLDGGKIIADTLYASSIKAGTITADRIQIGGVETDRIASGAVSASGGYGASASTTLYRGDSIPFWTPNQSAVTYGRGNIAFTSSLGCLVSLTVSMPVTVYIYRNGIQVRSTTIQVPTTVKQLTIPITYLDTNKSSSATTYSFQIYAGTYTGSNIDDYIFVYSIDEFWVEYKR
jgi:uncharacterized protein YjbI with pentapeptide repeats